MERGKGVPKEREVEIRREICEWEGFVCAGEVIGTPSMFEGYGCVLVEDVADFKFELEVKSSAFEVELVLVVLHILNS